MVSGWGWWWGVVGEVGGDTWGCGKSLKIMPGGGGGGLLERFPTKDCGSGGRPTSLND